MHDAVILTIDIDWAPDFVIDWLATRLIQRRVKATWFVTHASAAVDRLRHHPDLFELGIHPNFLPNSTHGSAPDEVLRHCMEIVPEAVSMRTHSLVQSSPLLALAARSTPIKIDVSLFLPYAPHLQPIDYYFGGHRLTRAPFFWEDDMEMERPAPDWTLSVLKTLPGLKIFNFHPLHVYLNSPDMMPYRALKDAAPTLQQAQPEQVDPHIFGGLGAGTALKTLIEQVSTGRSQTVAEMVQAWTQTANPD